ncbi:MAG: glycosyltransferase family 4 protein [Parcubacteria group bacterium]|nr:glycosyltransferase family 4 protein [Parcubacteria group bacterium]
MKIYMIGQKGIPTPQGGVERHVEDLAKHLTANGHEVFVYCRKKYNPHTPQTHAGISLIYKPAVYTKHLEAITHTFLASLDVLKRDVDIIHYHGIGPSSLLWIPKLFKKNVKIISTYHCQDYKHTKWGWFARLYLKLGEWIACKFADRLIVISPILRGYVQNTYGRAAEYIPYGVSDLFHESRGCDGAILREFGVEPNGYYLAVSRLIPLKRLDDLIDAFDQLNTSKKLVIAGGSSYTDGYKQKLMEKAKGNPNILFVGEQRDVRLAALYRYAYAFVHPSETEGLSMSLLEALKMGKCVLVSDIPENTAVIGDNGVSFKAKDISDLKAKLQYLEDNPNIAAELGERAVLAVGENYDWKNIVRDMEMVYAS